MDEDGEGPKWSSLIKPQECWRPMHALLKHTSLHDQVPMRNTIMLMEVE
jgi:hypothetical protein